MTQSIAKPKSKVAVRKARKFQIRTHKATGKAARKATVGIVSYWIHGDSGRENVEVVTPSTLIKVLENGLPVRELDELRDHLDLPMDKLAPMLSMSKATLHRRKASGRLDVTESDRVVRYARLLGKAASVMESIENGRRWLAAPQVGLGGAVPLEYAQTEFGAREVENLLGRIEYGVYS